MTREGLSWSGREAKCIFLNLDGRSFCDVSGPSGLDFIDDGRGAAVVDWDHDGLLDLWLTNRTAPTLRFMRNASAPDGSYLALRLKPRAATAVGARVELELSGVKPERRIRTLHAGEGFLSQGSSWLHFSFPEQAEIRRARVRWPSRATEEFTGLAPDGHFELVEGAGVAEPWQPPEGATRLAASKPVVPAPSERARLLLAGRLPLPDLAGTDAKGASFSLHAGRPTLLLLWASWCKPCNGELSELGRRADELRARGLDLVALSTDEPADWPDAERILEELAWPYRSGFAPAELVETLDVVQRAQIFRLKQLPLPSSFLVNAKRELVAIYKGPVAPETLLADLALTDADQEKLVRACTPLSGRLLFEVEEVKDQAALVAKELVSRGLLARAADFYLSSPHPAGGAESAETRAHMVALLGLAQKLVEAGEFAPASRLLARGAEIDPANIGLRLELADCLARASRASEAEAAYRGILQERPQNTAAYRGLSELLIQARRNEEALALLETLAERDLAWLHWHRARACDALGREEAATSHARLALQVNPDLEVARAFLLSREAGRAPDR